MILWCRKGVRSSIWLWAVEVAAESITVAVGALGGFVRELLLLLHLPTRWPLEQVALRLLPTETGATVHPHLSALLHLPEEVLAVEVTVLAFREAAEGREVAQEGTLSVPLLLEVLGTRQPPFRHKVLQAVRLRLLEALAEAGHRKREQTRLFST
jgi:hypothetical protein